MSTRKKAYQAGSKQPGVRVRWWRGAAASLATSTWMLALLFALQAAPVARADEQVQVNVQVLPIASLTFLDSPLLYLAVPPPGSTFPSSGVRFRVTGNAKAILTATPDAFIQIPSHNGDYLGKAVLNGNAVGYNIDLLFPSNGIVGSPIQISTLPGSQGDGTYPPLAVNMTLTGGIRDGVIHLEASQNWTADSGLPLPGVYVGSVTLTLTADNL